MSNADLIAEARGKMERAVWMPAGLAIRLADALEAAEKELDAAIKHAADIERVSMSDGERIAELEAALEDESGRANTEHLRFARAHQRALELAAVIEQAKALPHVFITTRRNGYVVEDYSNPLFGVKELEAILTTADTSVLADRDAEKFDEGWIARAGRDIIRPEPDAPAPHPSLNPYRREEPKK